MNPLSPSPTVPPLGGAPTLTPLAPPTSAFPPATLFALGTLFLLTLALAPILARLACRAFGLEKPNFRGDVVPAATGIGTLIFAAIVYGGLSATGAPLAVAAPLFLIVSVGFGLLGLLDDKWGSRAVGGFGGHLRSLATGRPTTGVVKLIGGGLVALVAATLRESPHVAADWIRVVLDGAVIALAANALNLLDVRPGRAQFGFFLLALISVVAVLREGWDWVSVHPPAAVLLGPLAFAALVEWWPDSHGRAMMGDVGSNLLGAAAGLAAVTVLPIWGRIILLIVLLALNALAERVSLTRLIAENRVLNAMDRQLGPR